MSPSVWLHIIWTSKRPLPIQPPAATTKSSCASTARFTSSWSRSWAWSSGRAPSPPNRSCRSPQRRASSSSSSNFGVSSCAPSSRRTWAATWTYFPPKICRSSRTNPQPITTPNPPPSRISATSYSPSWPISKNTTILSLWTLGPRIITSQNSRKSTRNWEWNSKQQGQQPWMTHPKTKIRSR